MSATKRLLAALAAVISLIIATASLGAPASAYPAGVAPEITVANTTIPAGSGTTVNGSQFTPNSSVNLSLHSAPVDLGTVTTDGNGAFSAAVTIPADTAAGAHTIEALDTPTGDVASAGIVVTAGGDNGGGDGGLGNTGVAVLGLGALGLVLLVGGGLMVMAGRRRKVTTI